MCFARQFATTTKLSTATRKPAVNLLNLCECCPAVFVVQIHVVQYMYRIEINFATVYRATRTLRIDTRRVGITALMFSVDDNTSVFRQQITAKEMVMTSNLAPGFPPMLRLQIRTGQGADSETACTPVLQQNVLQDTSPHTMKFPSNKTLKTLWHRNQNFVAAQKILPRALGMASAT